MELRQLRYFVAVAEELHFTRAAARLNIGQPPLSIQIKAIEEELGVRLFERSRHRVALTPAGDVLLQGAYKIFAQFDDVILAAQRVSRGEIGTVRIGFSSDAPLAPVFRLGVREHRLSLPQVRLDLSSLTAVSQIEGLLTDRLDVGFMRSSPFRRLPREIATVRVLKDKLAVVLPLGHALGGQKRPLPIKALRDEPFVFFPPGVGTYDHVVALCARSGFMPKTVQASGDSASIISLVETGLGVSIVPAVFRNSSGPGVSFRDLAEADAASDVLMAWRTDERTPQALGFINLVKQLAVQQGMPTTASDPPAPKALAPVSRPRRG